MICIKARTVIWLSLIHIFLERFQRAQTEIDDSQIPPEPEDGFERLLDKIEEKGIEPQYILSLIHIWSRLKM